MAFVPPKHKEKRFNCPFCNAFADQHWDSIRYISERGTDTSTNFSISKCISCGKLSMWLLTELVSPNLTTAPLPNSDMPEDIKIDYEEARSISIKSPRGACALLRLCVEKLCIHLGEESGDLSAKIGNLVTKGLRPAIQQSLDVVRVIGNESVHPGTLDVRDDPQTTDTLFELINLIIQTMITDPKKAQEIFDKIPQSKKDGIEHRDDPT